MSTFSLSENWRRFCLTRGPEELIVGQQNAQLNHGTDTLQLQLTSTNVLTLGVRRSVRTHQAGSDAARDDADAAWTVSVETGFPSSYLLLLMMMVGESFKDLTPKVQWKFVITKRNNDRE